MEKTYISIQTSLTVTVIVGLFFIGLGYLKSKKITNNKNYIVGDRDENVFSLTASLTASALGAWILFGPASAATWGGMGAIIGYALGTAAPMLFLFNNIFNSRSYSYSIFIKFYISSTVMDHSRHYFNNLSTLHIERWI